MLRLRYHTHHLELSGYGRAAAGYLGAIERVNDGSVEVDVLPIETSSPAAEADIAIYHTTPSRLAKVVRHPARRHVAMTTWETEPMPEEHIAVLNSFDAVIVPSTFCQFLIPRGTPLYVIPHTFDPEVWLPESTPRPPSTGGAARPDDVLTFYSIGAWGERKNTLGLLKAYLHAFKKVDRTRLVLVVEKVNMAAVRSLLARSLIPQSELPGLVIPGERLSDDEMLKLHRDGDCFVTVTRAEGFGLPIFEAAIMGKPIIASMWGGQAEFLEGYLPWRKVWHAMTPVFPGEDDVSIEGNEMRVQVTLPAGANSKQLWAEPSLDRLAFEMRGVLIDFHRGKLSDNHTRREHFERYYGYDAIGAKFINTLKEILK